MHNARRPIDVLAVVAAAIPVAIVLVLLVPVVDVDPIAGVTSSNSPFTDEAWTVLNARNWAIFGMPATDEWALWVLTVPFTVIDAVVFRLFGVGIVQARLVDVGCVAITAGLLGLVLRRPFGTPAAIVVGVAYGTSALVLFYGRMAYLEPMAGMFLTIATLTLLGVDGRRAGSWGIIGGVALALAVGTKATTLPAALAVVGVAGIAAIRLPAARAWLAGSATTLVAGAVAWVVFVAAPNREAVANVVERIYPPAAQPSIAGFISRMLDYPLGHNDRAVRFMAPLLVAAGGGAVVGALRLRRLSLGTRLILGASLAGFTVGLASIVLGIGNASRYVVFLLPWLALLAAPFVAAIIDRVDAMRRPPMLPAAPGRSGPRAWLAAGIVAAVLAVQGVGLQVSWMRSATRELVTVQAEAAESIAPGTVVAGGYAPLLAMTADALTIVPCCGARPVNAGDLYADAGARVWANLAPPNWAPAHQAAWDARRPFACLTWTRYRHRLCLEQIP